MKKVRSTYRFIAPLLAFLMCLTSVSLAIDMHYCQGQLKSISLWGKAKNCHDKAEPMQSCPFHKMMAQKVDCSKVDKNCCSNRTLQVNLDQNQQTSTLDSAINPQAQQLVIAQVFTLLKCNLVTENNELTFAHYKPPLRSLDIPVLIQSFLL